MHAVQRRGVGGLKFGLAAKDRLLTPAAGLMAVSYGGPLFEMVIPIAIPGGTPFKVNITQMVATAADEQVKCLLIGTLTRP